MKRSDRAQDRLEIRCHPSERIVVPVEVVDRVEAAYDGGRYLDALSVAEAAGPVFRWGGTRARVMAARLATRLGGDRLSTLLATRAWREDRRDALATMYFAYELWGRKGPLGVWEFTRDWRDLENLDDRLAADFLTIRARIAASYRDFASAWRMHDEARGLAGRTAWLVTEEANTLWREDREEEALDATSRAMELQPWFRPAVVVRAHVLQSLRRDDEALALVEEAARHMQSGELVMHWMAMLRERDDFHGMDRLLEEYERLSPLLEPAGRRWLAARRCDSYCLQGRHAEAAVEAEHAGGEYYEELSKRLKSPPDAPRRVRLTPPRLIQRHNTCGPTTLAMIAGHWRHEATREAITDAICYDGTYDHTERQWCLDNGFVAREFRVDWEAACALLDAGIPFAMATTEVGSGHLQAVVGYDGMRRTLILQDPSSHHFREVEADSFLKEYALHGPRGLAVVPEAERERLSALALPEAEEYDLVFAFNRALHVHDRERAAEIVAELEARAPGHRLTWQLRWSLASYDADRDSSARAVEALAEMHPENPRLVGPRAAHLRTSAPRAELIAFLRRHAMMETTHPAIWRDLAQELAQDARHQEEAEKWLAKACAALPFDALVVEARAERLWAAERREEAVELLGFASCWAPVDERLARRWFDASRMTGRRDEALDHLRARVKSLGHKSPQPSITLMNLLDDFHHEEEAMAVLAAALEAHPDDGDLRLHAARFFHYRDRRDEAAAHMEVARKRTPPGSWLRLRARFEESDGDQAAALATWREVAAREPNAEDAHGAIARLLSRLEGDPAVIAHLDEVCERFPNHQGLLGLRLNWLRPLAPRRAEAAARGMLELFPDNAWAARELALVLDEQNRREEAVVTAREALRMDPRAAASHGILASLLETSGAVEEAARHFREAIRLDADYQFAMRGLVGIAPDAKGRIEALRVIFAEMARQSLEGSGISTYHELASPLLEPGELLAQFEEIHRIRPDLFEAWQALIFHNLDMHQIDAALELCAKFTHAFARTPGAWRISAIIHRTAGRNDEALAHARVAVDLNRDWVASWRTLVSMLEETGRETEALATLREARRRMPDAGVFGYDEAAMLWRQGHRAEAFDLAMSVLARNPDYQALWELLDGWSERLGRGAEVLAAARRICEDRPGETAGWMRVAKMLPRSAMDEKLAICDRVLELNPRHVDACDLKAYLLCSQGRKDEARRACEPSGFPEGAPHNLRGRAAWVDAADDRLSVAIDAMRGILNDHPDYRWGWEQMLDWAGRNEDKALAAEARQALIRLSPGGVDALCKAADAAIEENKRGEALELYLSACQRDPYEAYPLHRALDLLWQERKINQIRELAAQAAPGLTRALGECYLVVADASERNFKAARERLREVLASPEPLRFVVDSMIEALRVCHGLGMWEKELDRAVKQRRIGMAFTSEWIQWRARRGDWKSWIWFSDWIQRGGEDASPALGDYFDLAGDNRTARYFHGFLKTPAAEWCRERTWLYGKIGYALANSENWQATASWLDGAVQRADSEGWLCLNLVLAHLHLGRDTKAAEVACAVRARGLRDHTWPLHGAVAACEAAIGGRVDEAATYLDTPTETNEGKLWIWLWHTARHAVAVLRLPPGSAEAVAAQNEACRDMRTRARAISPFPACMDRWWARGLAAMAAHSGKRPSLLHRHMRLFKVF